MKLSVLDQLPVSEHHTSVGAVTRTKNLAIEADKLGYTRMWFAEHHGGTDYASSAPEILSANIVEVTRNIRIGTGGTMIMHYSPLKLAEVFKTLSALAPGRIDFGVGRAPGGDMNATKALASGRTVQFDDMYEKFQTTLDYLLDRQPKVPLYQNLSAAPVHAELPEAWLLGSSGSSAIEAAERGVGYSFAQFFTGSMSKDIFDAYRNHFTPSYFLEQPQINVAYLVTVAETAEEADYLAGTADMHRLFMNKGKLAKLATPESAAEMKKHLTEMDRMRINEDRRVRHIVGTPKDVAQQLREAGNYYGFDEAMIVSLQHSEEKRLDVYRLLAKELL